MGMEWTEDEKRVACVIRRLRLSEEQSASRDAAGWGADRLHLGADGLDRAHACALALSLGIARASVGPEAAKWIDAVCSAPVGSPVQK